MIIGYLIGVLTGLFIMIFALMASLGDPSNKDQNDFIDHLGNMGIFLMAWPFIVYAWIWKKFR